MKRIVWLVTTLMMFSLPAQAQESPKSDGQATPQAQEETSKSRLHIHGFMFLPTEKIIFLVSKTDEKTGKQSERATEYEMDLVNGTMSSGGESVAINKYEALLMRRELDNISLYVRDSLAWWLEVQEKSKKTSESGTPRNGGGQQ
jgi:hypothetical protein